MAADPFTRYLRSMASERGSLLCDQVTQELRDLSEELATLQSAGVSLMGRHQLEDKSISIHELREKATDFVHSFNRIWHREDGTAHKAVVLPLTRTRDEVFRYKRTLNAVVLLRKFFTYTNDLAEVLVDIKDTQAKAVPIVSRLESRVDRLSRSAIALIEIRDAYRAGREEAFGESKSRPTRQHRDAPGGERPARGR